MLASQTCNFAVAHRAISLQVIIAEGNSYIYIYICAYGFWLPSSQQQLQLSPPGVLSPLLTCTQTEAMNNLSPPVR